MAVVKIVEKRAGGTSELAVVVDGKTVISIDGKAQEMDLQAELFKILAKGLAAAVTRERHTVEVIP